MSDNSKITKKQLNAAMTKAKKYTDSLISGGTGGGINIEDSTVDYQTARFDVKTPHRGNLAVVNISIDVEKYMNQTSNIDIKFTPTKFTNVKLAQFGITFSDSHSINYYSTDKTINLTTGTEQIFSWSSSTIDKNLLLIGFKITYDPNLDTGSTNIIEMSLDNISILIDGTNISLRNILGVKYSEAYSGEPELLNVYCTPGLSMQKLITRFKGKRYLGIGDSICANTPSDGDSNDRIPELIGNALDCKTINNISKSGMNMSGSASNSFYKIYKTYSYNYDLITIALGVNDCGGDGGVDNLGTIDSEDASTFLGSYNLVIKHIRSCNPYATIVLIPPFPTDYTKEEYIQGVMDLGKKYRLPVFNYYEFGVLESERILHDGIHYNKTGNYHIASRIAGFISSL